MLTNAYLQKNIKETPLEISEVQYIVLDNTIPSGDPWKFPRVDLKIHILYLVWKVGMNEPLGIFILGNFQGSKLHDLIANFILGEVFISQSTMLNIENMQLLKPSEVV